MAFVDKLSGDASAPHSLDEPVSLANPGQLPIQAEQTEIPRIGPREVRALPAFLPEDILRIIFEDLHMSIDNVRWDSETPRSYQLAVYSHVACVLVSVCRHWRDVGLRTPRIWATIYLRWSSDSEAPHGSRPPIAAEYAESFADMHLDRSMGLPLRFSMSIDSLITVQGAPKLIPRLLSQAARVESIILRIWTVIKEPASEIVLQYLRTPFTGLRHLDLSCVRCTIESYLGILRNMPALETLKLRGMHVTCITMEGFEAQVTLPRLHTLTLANIDSVHFMPGQLLLTPSLVSLTWSAPQYPHASPQLDAMLSAATLCPNWRCLRLEGLYSDEQRGCVGNYVVPNLRQLAQITNLTIANSDVPDDVMEALGDAAAPLCPGLTHLVLVHNYYEYERSMDGLKKRLRMQGVLEARLVDILIDERLYFDLLVDAAAEAGCELRLLPPGSRI